MHRAQVVIGSTARLDSVEALDLLPPVPRAQSWGWIRVATPKDCHDAQNQVMTSDHMKQLKTLLRLAARSWQDPNSGSTTSSQTAWWGWHICEVFTFWKKNQQRRSNLFFWLFCTGFWDHGKHWETYGFSVKSIPSGWHSLEVKYR